MEQPPNFRIAVSKWGMVQEACGWIALIWMWGFVVMNYSDLPESIPPFYHAFGAGSTTASRGSILVNPIVSTVIFVGLSFLNRYPHKLNYAVPITSENALRQYSNAMQLVRHLKFSIVLVFGGITLKTVQYIHGEIGEIGMWFLPLSLAFIFIPMIVFIRRSYTLG